MNLSDAQFGMAAAQIRMTATLLDHQISHLRDSHQWTGPDADRFYQEWAADVQGRLHAAANKLEALALIPFI